jgi:hypothetical protein
MESKNLDQDWIFRIDFQVGALFKFVGSHLKQVSSSGITQGTTDFQLFLISIL